MDDEIESLVPLLKSPVGITWPVRLALVAMIEGDANHTDVKLKTTRLPEYKTEKQKNSSKMKKRLKDHQIALFMASEGALKRGHLESCKLLAQEKYNCSESTVARAWLANKDNIREATENGHFDFPL